ncbi:hypothetical protein CVV43_02210 [Candidatus Saccharibacteria bacterium HGW-Saccharibacteria-1]|jgi:prepilin-type N-terminal cleavage/methylation domain-containing protein|nr:MAG: hypothetical protein CVV43_02210 [Candidatus Saccharibacteria bacterium HGW-Saccharibacteria-1]
MNARKKNKTSGFTIVELVISMVVIGILATIMFISYGGIIKKVAVENLKSDLLSATSKLAKFKATYGVYPVTISCSVPDSKTNLCIKGTTSDTIFAYNVNTTASPDTFGLSASKGNDVDLSYRTANGSEPIACPAGYIVVPGSKTYGTSDFCVMKYEAKIKGNDNGATTYDSSFIPETRASGTPWVYIDQIAARDESKTVCTGCHLISEAEWMTIAQNLLNVSSNWSGGTVGVGYIYSGHNDTDPENGIAASNDDDGYFGTNDFAGDNGVPPESTLIGDTQKRTLTLTNGEVIWDFSGNVNEWSDATIAGGKPGNTDDSGASVYWRNFSSLTSKPVLPVNIYPEGTGIEGASSWTSESMGIGKLGSNSNDTELRGFRRGGDFDDSGIDGVLSLRIDSSPDGIGNNNGFRVAR